LGKTRERLAFKDLISQRSRAITLRGLIRRWLEYYDFGGLSKREFYILKGKKSGPFLDISEGDLVFEA